MASSAEVLVTTSTVEDIAILVALEHSATETTLSAQDILNMVAQSLPEWN